MRELWQKIRQGLDRLSGRFINGLIKEWNDTKREARAIGRVLLSGIGLVPLVYGLQWVHRHPPADKPVGFMLAGLALIVFVIVLRRLGNGQGIAHGFWLWLLSLGLSIAMMAAALAGIATLAWITGDADAQGRDFIVGLVILWIVAAAFGHCDKVLKRAEEQTP